MITRTINIKDNRISIFVSGYNDRDKCRLNALELYSAIKDDKPNARFQSVYFYKIVPCGVKCERYIEHFNLVIDYPQ